LQIFPQDQHERLLIARLQELGVSVERQTELISYRDMGPLIVAHLRAPGGQEESCEAAYIAGSDGVHSIVRETMGTGYSGGTYRHLFYVADVEAFGPPPPPPSRPFPGRPRSPPPARSITPRNDYDKRIINPLTQCKLLKSPNYCLVCRIMFRRIALTPQRQGIAISGSARVVPAL
jgi:2-polyprenyl-6-methoxyphenol hydroxylase-like FAD-dependent oxidoreductase